jgi:hypothetical protein
MSAGAPVVSTLLTEVVTDKSVNLFPPMPADVFATAAAPDCEFIIVGIDGRAHRVRA